MAAKQPSNDEPIARARIGRSDDEILDRYKARARAARRMMRILVSGIALVLAATATAIFSGHAALVTGMWGRIVTEAILGALFVYAFVTIVQYSSSDLIRPIEADNPRLVHLRRDSNQRVWRRSMLFNVFVMFFIVMGLSAAFAFLRTAPQAPVLSQMLSMFGAFFAGFMLLLAFLLSAGPAPAFGAREPLNDEFDSALRARMMRFGYILVLLMLAAVFLVALWQPDLTLTALAWALYAGFAVPALYYIIADWRASRGDEG